MPVPEKQFGPGEGGPKKMERPEIEVLRERVEKLEVRLEKEAIPEKKEKMVKQEIKEYLHELQQTPATAAPLATRDEADEIKKFPPSQQVGALISLVFGKGLPEAISVAKNLNNPAILDEFHDVLVDRYYKTLIEKKIIKP